MDADASEPFACWLSSLAVTNSETWRGWMGIEPTQDASTAPQTVLKTAEPESKTVRRRPHRLRNRTRQSMVVRIDSPSLADTAVFAPLGELRSGAKIPLGTKGIR